MPPIRSDAVRDDHDHGVHGIGRHLIMSRTPSPGSMTKTKAAAGPRLSIASTGFTPRAYGRLSTGVFPRSGNIRPNLAPADEQDSRARSELRSRSIADEEGGAGDDEAEEEDSRETGRGRGRDSMVVHDSATHPRSHLPSLRRDIDDAHNSLSRLGDLSEEEQSQNGERRLTEDTENPAPNTIVDVEAKGGRNIPPSTDGDPPQSAAPTGSKRTRMNNLEQETALREFAEAVKAVLWPAVPPETASTLEDTDTESEGEEADAEERFKRAFLRVELLVPSTIEALRLLRGQKAGGYHTNAGLRLDLVLSTWIHLSPELSPHYPAYSAFPLPMATKDTVVTMQRVRGGSSHSTKIYRQQVLASWNVLASVVRGANTSTPISGSKLDRFMQRIFEKEPTWLGGARSGGGSVGVWDRAWAPPRPPSAPHSSSSSSASPSSSPRPAAMGDRGEDGI